MKVLHITAQSPDMKSGGGMGIYQTMISLTSNDVEVDYVGPELEDKIYQNYYSNVYELSACKNIFIRAWDVLHGITNSRFRSWKALNINFNLYDVVVLDFTKLDYVAKEVNTKSLIVRVHNVEHDYARADYQTHKSLVKWIVMYLSTRQERIVLKNATKIVTLTKHDSDRIQQLYGNMKNKILIVPVCVNKQQDDMLPPDKKLRLLITGSLWFGENHAGVIWFIEHVCNLITVPFELVVAGARPTEEIKALDSKSDFLSIIDSPENMKPYFENTDIVIAPIFSGAGMKVKVAEAFSYGKPVVGTSHAFEGYKVDNGRNSFIANSEQEFANAIIYYALLKDKDKREIHDSVCQLFSNNYNLNESIVRWNKILGNKDLA